MGQYYLIVNIDKKQYLHPHHFNEGLKLLEFGCSGEGTMTALALLLSDGNGQGGGDLHTEVKEFNKIIGSWAGDRVIIAGDYAKKRKVNGKSVDLFSYADENYEDISDKMLAIMMEDSWLKEDMEKDHKGKEWSLNKETYDKAIEWRRQLKLV